MPPPSHPARVEVARHDGRLAHAEPVLDDGHPAEIKAREAELRAIWARCDLRNDRVRAVTGVRFRPDAESLRDCVESLLAVGQVQPRLA